jgi:hypothetical protein
MMVEIAIAGIVTATLLLAANGKFKLVHRFKEWRYGRKIDETTEWAAFNAAFRDQE